MKCVCSCSVPKADKTIIEALQTEMDKQGYISKDAIVRISKTYGYAQSEIYGVATFYSQFSLVPKAKYNISVCMGTACFVLGASEVFDAFKKVLGLDDIGITQDKMFSLSVTRCLGACSLAPAVMINGEIYSRVKPSNVSGILEALKKGQK